MIRARRARIVATLGPASRDAAQIRALAEAGADVFRVNFSHGGHKDHARTIANVRAVETLVGRPLAVLADLQGPKLRLGEFAHGQVRLKSLDRDSQRQASATPAEFHQRLNQVQFQVCRFPIVQPTPWECRPRYAQC